jgi:hypothetical protein
VNDFELMTALIQHHPGFMWTFMVAAAGFIFNAGGTYVNFRYMRTSMVTKKDLKIAMLEFGDGLKEDYVTRQEFAQFNTKTDKPNGRARGAGHGV